jgi:glycosyltransferase involved in cell wall biosynthesis
MIARHGLDGVVQLLGQRGDVPQLLAAADLYVSPSLSEGAPVTHLEAMAAGTPVVATAVGGVPELIDDGQNGLLVPAGQPEPLANAILRALDNPDVMRRLAERGRMTVRNYGAEAWARRIEDEYLRLLPGRGVQVAQEVAR